MRLLAALGVALVSGCGSSSSDPVDGSVSSDGAVVVDASGDGAVTTGSGCPRIRLGSSLPSTYSGDTTSLANIVTSPRLEWTDAPDDSLEFTAPVAGNYVFELTSPVIELGLSAQDYNTTGTNAFPFTSSHCPAAGAAPAQINGIYNHNQPNYPVALTAGQTIVMFVSAPYWATTKVGPYTLTVRKLP